MKIGDPINALIHESGEDIIVSYRTGEIALIKDNKIARIYTNETYQQIGWQREDWNSQKLLEEEQKAKAKEEAEVLQASAKALIELKRKSRNQKKAVR